jgi:hypothetical protein
VLSLLLAGALAASPLAEAEQAFLAFRDADDLVRLKATTRRQTRRRDKAAEAATVLARVDASALSPEDRRALEAMRRALAPPRRGGSRRPIHVRGVAGLLSRSRWTGGR